MTDGIDRQGKPPQDKNREIESYINRGQPAPQPNLNRDLSSAIERESNKRRNGGN
ncbi:hypothetical protein [Bradyrhizobium erythrophlei]|uniref:Uncharacterized protein n=1 Tax=Bradyrhizobium erythrophlei TaxID=1437360 RepID=A0A1H4NGZ5_9BRAD|nr:hypothetical protein [Bradyrhizobium erythrophlei]SEB94481.1 hypothetical protein SAMN05444164_0627 [Bradyrhizobium erythrophlei]